VFIIITDQIIRRTKRTSKTVPEDHQAVDIEYQTCHSAAQQLMTSREAPAQFP